MKRGYDLPSDAPGVYRPVRTDRDVPFAKFYRPDDLPPDVTLSDDTIRLVERAMHALGRLDGFSGRVEAAPTVLKPLLYKEAEQSSQIEGTQVTTTDMYRATAGGNPSARSRDVAEATNYVAALQSASERLLGRGRSREHLTRDLLLELHETVMDTGQREEADPSPGEFRSDYAWIEESGEPWQQSIRFVPPKAEMVEPAMDALLSYAQSPSRFPDVVDVALVHYQLETIHPFEDGNGRVGRLLTILMLVACDALTTPLFYVSAYLEANRETYTDRLLAVSEDGEWEEWIRFFVSGLRDQAEEVLGRTKLLQDQFEAYRREYDDAPTSVRRLVEVLFEQPYITIPTAAERIDMSYPAASSAVDRLVDDGVLHLVEEKERNREYVAGDVMAIVERDADALPSPADVLE